MNRTVVMGALALCGSVWAEGPCSKKGDDATGSAGTANTAASGSSGQGAADGPTCKEDNNKSMSNGKLKRCLLDKPYKSGPYTCAAGKMYEAQADGSLKGCYLQTAVTVSGVSCKDGLDLYPDGKLRRCKVEADKTIGEVSIKTGDWLTLFASGAVKRLEVGAAKRELKKGFTCRGYLNYFHENGQLKKCELGEPATVNGKPAKVGEFACFDDGGKPVADCKALSWDMIE